MERLVVTFVDVRLVRYDIGDRKALAPNVPGPLALVRRRGSTPQEAIWKCLAHILSPFA